MTNIIALVAGIVLVVGTIAAFLCSINKTPNSLRGFYGAFYAILSLFGLLGGVGCILLSFAL